MKRVTLSFLVLALLRGSLSAQPPSAEGIEFFERKIRPVLVAQCYQCHSVEAEKVKKLRGGLFLDSRAGILKGGESGPGLIAGKAKESLLTKALHYTDDLRMPPKGKLAENVIADFERWIAMGAPDPRDGKEVAIKKGVNIDAGRKYWAFQPLKAVIPPVVKQKDWLRNPIDAFILATLESKSLTPNPAAEREKLLRRVYFDLIGLPPTPAEVDAFLKDSSPDAYEKVVDRLLASPHHGERWARHWLDVARYAESGGYEFDGDRAGAYHYRDFVIKALNQDMPYSEFVRLQLAGDRMRPSDFDAVAATGFLVSGPYPGQITAKTRERIRYDHLDDMIATAGNAFLGLSLGCARCHAHKYDPIPQEDYYRLISCLSNTDSSRTKLDPIPEETKKAKAEFDTAHQKLKQTLAAYEREQWLPRFQTWLKTESAKPAASWWTLNPMKTTSKAQFRTLADGSILAGGKAGPNDAITITAHTNLKEITGLRLDALTDASLPGKGPGRAADGNFLLSEISVTAAPLVGKGKATPIKLRAVAASFETKERLLQHSVDANKKSGWSISGQTGKDHAGVYAFETPLKGHAGGTLLTITLKFDGGAALGKLRVNIATGALPALNAGVALQNVREIQELLAPNTGKIDDKNREAVARWHRAFDAELDKQIAVVEKHAAAEPKPKLLDAFVATNVGRDPVHFLIRGEVERKSAKSTPGFIQVLMNSPEKDEKWVKANKAEKAEKAADKEPRIALAEWITDAEHGAGNLLARVMVNRLWQHHLGRGIVATPNDFGSQGEPATHPELLEFLAKELITNGWRLKPIHKLIVTSAVYRLGNQPNPDAEKADPENRLLWRRPPRRLEAEAIRDSLLTVSGTLDPALYGPSTADENSARRSIYLTVKRSRPIPLMQLFDAPEAIQSIAVRPATTVPTQALALMNAPLVRQRAEKLAVRLGAKTPAQVGQAIEQAYQIALTRRPTEKESARMGAFVTRQAESYAGNPRALEMAMADFCQVLLCSNEFVFVD